MHFFFATGESLMHSCIMLSQARLAALEMYRKIKRQQGEIICFVH